MKTGSQGSDSGANPLLEDMAEFSACKELGEIIFIILNYFADCVIGVPDLFRDGRDGKAQQMQPHNHSVADALSGCGTRLSGTVGVPLYILRLEANGILLSGRNAQIIDDALGFEFIALLRGGRQIALNFAVTQRLTEGCAGSLAKVQSFLVVHARHLGGGEQIQAIVIPVAGLDRADGGKAQ